MLARYGSLAVFLALVVTASFLAGSFEAGEWYYQRLARPSWTPPGWFIGAAWSLLYVLAAVAAWQVWLTGHYARLGALAWWVLLLVLNVFWSALFFGLHRIVLALLDLGLAVGIALFCTRAFLPMGKQSAYLMAPLLLWLLFIWALNLVILAMNGGLPGRPLTSGSTEIRVEDVEFVAIEVTEIGCIEAVHALAGRPLVAASQFNRLVIDRVHFLF